MTASEIETSQVTYSVDQLIFFLHVVLALDDSLLAAPNYGKIS